MQQMMVGSKALRQKRQHYGGRNKGLALKGGPTELGSGIRDSEHLCHFTLLKEKWRMRSPMIGEAYLGTCEQSPGTAAGVWSGWRIHIEDSWKRQQNGRENILAIGWKNKTARSGRTPEAVSESEYKQGQHGSGCLVAQTTARNALAPTEGIRHVSCMERREMAPPGRCPRHVAHAALFHERESRGMPSIDYGRISKR